MRAQTLLALAAASALALAACTPGGAAPASPSTSASSSPTASASASPTPSASPSPSAAAASCADDQIVPGRLGCLDTNEVTTAAPAGLVTFAPDHCEPGVGRWLYAPNPDMVAIDGDDTVIVSRIDVYDPALTTPQGIHVGSSEADVIAAYPGVPITTSFSGTKLLVQTSVEGSYVIELADGWGAEAWAVANIRIYAAGLDGNYPVYGTEDFAGACPFTF